MHTYANKMKNSIGKVRDINCKQKRTLTYSICLDAIYNGDFARNERMKTLFSGMCTTCVVFYGRIFQKFIETLDNQLLCISCILSEVGFILAAFSLSRQSSFVKRKQASETDEEWRDRDRKLSLAIATLSFFSL